MCGRYALYGPKSRWRDFEVDDGTVDFAPRYNIAPLQMAPVIRFSPGGGREARLLRWGLLPAWAKDETLAGKLINARAETVAEKPSFRAAYKARRCLVPASGFYEWKQLPGAKQPYFIHGDEERLLGFAGLWESWRQPDGTPLETYAIVTTAARDAMGDIHERMPVMINPEDYGLWLDPKTHPDLVRQLLNPARFPDLAMHPVARAVGNVRNEGPELVAPVAAGEEHGQDL